MRRRALLAVALAALLATSGCVGLGVLGDGAETPPEVDVVDEYGDLGTLEATRVTTFDTGNGTEETRALVRVDLSGDRFRQFERVLAPESRAGDVTVVDEDGAMLYDADENEVTRVPQTAGGARANRSAYLDRVVSAARSDDVAAPSEGVSPLPVVPATRSGPSIPADAIEGFEVEYLGTDRVAGRTAHGFELTAVSEAALSANRTLWLDSEYYYPLATSQRLTFGNRTVETSTRLTDVTFDADLPADAFAFEVPENATVETLDVPTQSFDSVRALREHVAFSVPEPEVPATYEFDGARYVGGNATRATLQYDSPDGQRLTVTKATSAPDEGFFESGENVTVAGRDAKYVTTPRTKFVSWTCEDARYSVVATDLDEDALLAVAESVACG
ncbi:LolA family protein [Halobacterium hubeiense]|uniref:LolA family protein n=1 Tax=Halobacterium hubeiense TaxID=1407499 RepID=UPI003C771E7A